MEKTTITITHEEFMNAVDCADEEFRAVGGAASKLSLVHYLMISLQNKLFGAKLADHLFSSEEKENLSSDSSEGDVCVE